MGDKRNKYLDLKSIIALVVVISFITSVLAGFVAGGLGYDLIRKWNVLNEGENNLSAGEESERQNLSASEKIISAEEKIIEVVKKVSPSVVSIVVTKDLPVLKQYPFEEDNFFERFFGDDFFSFDYPQYYQEGTEKREVGGGTGFIISAEGLILTNKHVVSDQDAEYTVLTNDEEEFAAQVLAVDPVQDIAILKIDKSGLPSIELGNSDELEIGQTVIAIGNALGEFRNTVSVGIISGLRRSIQASSGFGQSEYLSEVIQTDAAVNQGNSGGPLLNLKGEAIGINVAMAQGAENIGFSLPINKAKKDIEQVKKEGKITYPFLGVRYVLINPEIQKENQLSLDYGALIIRGSEISELAIIPGSPADKAGLVENDIILEIDGEKINEDNTLAESIQKYEVGEKVNLKILHKGEYKTIEVELGER